MHSRRSSKKISHCQLHPHYGSRFQAAADLTWPSAPASAGRRPGTGSSAPSIILTSARRLQVVYALGAQPLPAPLHTMSLCRFGDAWRLGWLLPWLSFVRHSSACAVAHAGAPAPAGAPAIGPGNPHSAWHSLPGEGQTATHWPGLSRTILATLTFSSSPRPCPALFCGQDRDRRLALFARRRAPWNHLCGPVGLASAMTVPSK